MKIGICTTDFRRMGARELFSKIRTMGYEAVQLSFDSVEECGFCADSHIEIPETVSDEALSLIKEESQGLEIVAVNGTFNMAHPDSAVRAEGLRRFDGFARAVQKLGCTRISLCSGTRSLKSLWSASDENHSPEAWRDMISTMSAACDIAEKYGLVLAIETEAGNVIDTPERAVLCMREVGSPALKMIMDCANLFHKGEAKCENVRAIIGHAFDVFGKDVEIAHGKDIAETDGISFCAAGEGIVDFPYFVERLKECGYRGTMMLHGIYDEDKMPICRQFIADVLAKSAE